MSLIGSSRQILHPGTGCQLLGYWPEVARTFQGSRNSVSAGQEYLVSCGVKQTAPWGHKKKARTKSRAFVVSVGGGSVVHTAHTAHTTARHSRDPTILLWLFGHHGFRGDQKPGDRRRVLQGRSNNFGRINNSLA